MLDYALVHKLVAMQQDGWQACRANPSASHCSERLACSLSRGTPPPPHLHALQFGAVSPQLLVALQIGGLEAGAGVRLLLAAKCCWLRRRRGGRLRRQRSRRGAVAGGGRGRWGRHAELRQVLPDLAGLREGRGYASQRVRCSRNDALLST